jgi:Ohr subfamily peroxiredoxin
VNALYTANVVSIGGRNGSIRSDDGLLDTPVSLPKAMGGKGNATNPEQLFAGGYAACFGNAVIHVARSTEHKVKDEDVQVDAKVGVGLNATGGFGLTVALDVTIAGLDQQAAEQLVEAAHRACPYSNAVRGNIDVDITVHTR